ncbi:arginase family protein [Erwinia sp. S43]|uniref:arginase family protein n=1 Tax=unclassified Erwinia TaxID=2622719 RepID=UPI00190C675C|nr:MULTISPECIES: arginase family protein [unclassified Erwinia]MBK0035130.1 arginase family protein [Erwinia sp. S43]MCW1875974.1 arginase family protein [Erwinia sp. INIA01]
MKTQTGLLRMVLPQWQGGNNPVYELGAELLAWLVPSSSAPTVQIPLVREPGPLRNEQGVMGRHQLLGQLDAAWAAIHSHRPGKIVMLGGDCLVDLAPFAWLSEVYGDKFGILWIDSHPDVMTPAQFEHAHAHVLGSLMGEGDADFSRTVNVPVAGQRIMIAGLHGESDYERGFIAKHGIHTCSPEAIQAGAAEIFSWIEKENIEFLAVHFDLDILNPQTFRSLYFSRPDADAHAFDGIAQGKLELDEVLSLITAVDNKTTLVGLGIAEHLPWDVWNLKRTLSRMPLLKE